MNLLEARWLGERLSTFPDSELFPLVNVGSSTLEFRTRVQPYIDDQVFAPLRRRGGKVYHIDIKPDAGVDIVGDLLDARFRRSLAELKPQSVMISNLLEHVPAEDRAGICQGVLRLLPVGGYLFVTGPLDYPYHADPIDTMFRPSVAEVSAQFPGTRLVHSAVIDSGNWRAWNVAERGRSLPRALARLLFPFYRPRKWLELVRQTPYIFRHITAFAVVLRKEVQVEPAAATAPAAGQPPVATQAAVAARHADGLVRMA